MRTIKREKRKGQVVVIFVLVLAGLMMLIGLALDGGLTFAKRRQMQNAADAASLAGAQEIVSGAIYNREVYDRIHEYSVTRNGATSFTATYLPGNNPVPQNDSRIPEGAEGVCVRNRGVHQTAFVALLGITSLEASAEACAEAEGRCPSPGYAIWANGTNCEKTLEWSGSNVYVVGNVHSNGSVYMGGSNNTIVGRLEHVTGFFNSGQGNVVTPTQTIPAPLPFEYDINDYRPGRFEACTCGAPGCSPSPPCQRYLAAGRFAQEAIDAGQYYAYPGDHDIKNDNFREGLYYINGKATFGDSGNQGDPPSDLTIVAEGLIDISGSNRNFLPYSNGLLLFSNQQAQNPCTDPIIKLAGSNNRWNGVVYAPGGLVDLSGSVNSSLTGSIIGHAVKLPGSSQGFSFSDDYCPIEARRGTVRLRGQPPP